MGEKRLQMSCVLEAGQPWGVCAIGAEGRQRECGSGPLSGMSPGIRPRGAAAFHPSPAAGAREQQRSTHRTSWERAASVREAARPPRTEFSAGKSGLHSVSSSLFSALLPFLFLLFPGSGHGRCDALRIQKVQQLCLGNFNAILFELCVQISQLDGLVEENPVVQSCV